MVSIAILTDNWCEMNAEQTKAILANLPENSNVILTGWLGIGKINMLFEYAKEADIEIRDIRASQMIISDLIGLPFTSNGGNKTNALPTYWPEDKSSCGILLFSECSKAMMDVSFEIYNILSAQKRMIGNYKIPSGWIVIIDADSHNAEADLRQFKIIDFTLE